MNTDDIKRLYFYEKQFLGVRDFQDEQVYHIEMRRRHLIAHHLWGIVAGLEIRQDQNSKVWYVQPGMAVDGFGFFAMFPLIVLLVLIVSYVSYHKMIAVKTKTT